MVYNKPCGISVYADILPAASYNLAFNISLVFSFFVKEHVFNTNPFVFLKIPTGEFFGFHFEN